MKNPKTILITGASSGIGKALAEQYAASGVTLYLLGRNEQRLEEVAGNCRALGAVAHAGCIDVTDARAMRNYILQADSRTSLDLVIANAGISNAGEVKNEQFERTIFAVNLDGVLNTIYPALDVMQPRKRGQIVLMSSLAAMHGIPRASAYSASKAAIKTFGEGLRNKLHRDGIEVNVVCPGFIKTPLTDLNDYAMPFIMSAERGASIIAKGLRNNKGLIAFPWQMYVPLWLLRLLPHRLAGRILRWV